MVVLVEGTAVAAWPTPRVISVVGAELFPVSTAQAVVRMFRRQGVVHLERLNTLHLRNRAIHR